jgi:uncharacterized protein involved in tolerance to divalent cations
MTINPSHILNNSRLDNNFWDLKILAQKYISSILNKYRVTLKTGYVKRLNKRLEKCVVIYAGILSMMEKGLTVEEAKEMLLIVRKAFKKNRQLYASLEELKFFHNHDTEVIATDLLSTIYKIESITRRIAHSNTKAKDKNLENFTSRISRRNLSSLNA